ARIGLRPIRVLSCSELSTSLAYGSLRAIACWISRRTELPRRRLPEPRRALLDEGRHRLAMLGRLPALAQLLGLRALYVGEVRGRPVAREQLLDHAQLRPRVGPDLARQLERLGEQLIGRHQAVGEPLLVGFGGRIEPARETHLAGAPEAHALH